jgi:GNAT superfamily N-acetyltransferase
MDKPLDVRPATPSDVDELRPLVRDFATSFHPGGDEIRDALGRLLASPDALLLVATRSNQVVGYLAAHTHPALFTGAAVAWVEELMVDSAEQRAGVGRALMDAAESWASDSGAVYLALATRRAGDFYLALGYEESAVFYRKLLASAGD